MKYINRRPAGSPALPLFKRDILANGKDIPGRFNVSRFLLSGDIDFSCGVVTTLLFNLPCILNQFMKRL